MHRDIPDSDGLPMEFHVETELYASIATLDQLKKMYDMGVVGVRSYRRESEALMLDVKSNIERMRHQGRDVQNFIYGERIIDRFPDAADLLQFFSEGSNGPPRGMTEEEYYDQIGLAVLDVVTANASKGLMGLAELIVRVVRRLPELNSVSYNDVIESVNRVAEHGLLPGIRTLRGGVKVVELRPLELRSDQAEVINLAAANGYVTLEQVMMELRWSEDHARQVLGSLVEAGIAVADIKFSSGGKYYFPGLRSDHEHNNGKKAG